MDNIILDTDTYNECDDQFALAYLLKNQDKFNIEAITVAPYSHSDRKETIEETTEKSYNEILIKRKPITFPIIPFLFINLSFDSFLLSL